MSEKSYYGSPDTRENTLRPVSRKGRPSINKPALEKVQQLEDFLDTIEGKTDSLKRTHNFIENELRAIEERESGVMQDYSESRSKFLHLNIELEEAQKTIESLKRVLEREKTRSRELEISYQQQEEKNMKKQKEEMEEIIKKHLDFIDQLVNDKKELGDQCETLMSTLKEVEAKNSKYVADLKEKFQREIKNSKDVWAASEKQRREKWIKEKTNEIKEITIKGLEPEIGRIMNQGKDDVKKVEDKYRSEISKTREEMYWEYEEKLKAYKEKTLRENDEKIQKEREYMDERLKEQYEKTEKRIAEERERIKISYEAKFEDFENQKNKEIFQLKEKIKKLEEGKLSETKKGK